MNKIQNDKRKSNASEITIKSFKTDKIEIETSQKVTCYYFSYSQPTISPSLWIYFRWHRGPLIALHCHQWNIVLEFLIPPTPKLSGGFCHLESRNSHCLSYQLLSGKPEPLISSFLHLWEEPLWPVFLPDDTGFLCCRHIVSSPSFCRRGTWDRCRYRAPMLELFN